MKKTPVRVATPPPSPSETADSWYYNIKGKRVGPVDAEQIRSLAAQGVIDNATLVWREGFNDWIPIGQTTLKLVPSAPTPLPGKAVSNGLVWTVAFMPILGTLLEHLIAGMIESDPNNLWFITLWLNVGICVADDKVLKKAGHDTKKFGGWAAWLVPVYLFKRAKALNLRPRVFCHLDDLFCHFLIPVGAR